MAHCGMISGVIFTIILIIYLIVVLVLAPWTYTSEAEIYQSGDSILIDLNSQLWSSLQVSPFDIGANNGTFYLAAYDTLPPSIQINRETLFPLTLYRYSSLELPFRMNSGSSFTIHWELSQSVKFYIFNEREYNSWKNPDDVEWWTPISTDDVEEPISPATPASNHPFNRKISIKGSSGTANYAASKSGLYYLIWDCGSCGSRSFGTANITASLKQYLVGPDPCANATQCCTSNLLRSHCNINWGANSKSHIILSVPTSSNSFLELDVTSYGRYSFYFGVTLGSLGAFVFLLIVIFIVVRRCHHHHHRHNLYYQQIE